VRLNHPNLHSVTMDKKTMDKNMWRKDILSRRRQVSTKVCLPLLPAVVLCWAVPQYSHRSLLSQAPP
jgi:hypothetical protein